MGLFSSLFQIYPEERKKTLLFSMLAILWAFASTSANVLLDGLFLEKLGASYLPLSYILGALFGCVVSFLMITSLKRMSITFVYLCVISIDICAYVLLVTLHLTFPEVPKEVWFVYRVFAMTNYTVLTTSYWSFADSFHDMQDVKRIYSLLFAAIFTGAILGSFAVSSIVSTLKPIAIFSVVAALFFITGILISFIAKTLHMVHDEMIETPSNPRGEGFFSMLRNLFSSKYAIYLTIYSFLAEVLWNLTDYNYFYEFQVYFQGLNPTGFSSDPQLIEYIGLMRALASLINIFIGLFVFSKLIKRFGVTMIIFVPFSITAMIYIPWVGISNIFIASLAYLSIEGIQRAFGDNNFHLLVHGISGKIRISYRVIIASFLEPIAMMVAGLLLELPRVNTLLLGLFAAIFAILNCVVVSREYLKAIFANLQRNTLNLTQAAFKKLYFPAKLKKKAACKNKKVPSRNTAILCKNLPCPSPYSS